MKNKIPLLLHNANYYNSSGKLEKGNILIENGIISHISNDTMVLQDNYEQIDCSGRCVVPGFIDSHLHFPGDYLYQSFGVYLAEDFSIEGYIRCIEEVCNKELRFIRGYGWNHDVMNREHGLDGYKKIKQIIDRLFPDRMVVLFSDDYHSCICNQKLLQTYQTVRSYDYSLAEIGLMEEEDIFELPKQLPQLTFTQAEMKASIMLYQDMLLKNGITSAQTLMFLGGDNHTEWEALKSLEGEEQLVINVNLAQNMHEKDSCENIRKQYHKLQSYHTDKVHINTIKIYVDGVVENRTAFLTKPYEQSVSTGESLWEEKSLFEICRYFDQQNIQIHVHAIGNAAVHLITEALCYAMDENQSKRRNRHVITHLQLTDEADIKKMGEYGIIGCIQPYWIPKEEHYYSIDVKNIGDRVKEEYKVNSFFKNGVVVTASSDSPVTRFPNPINGIANAVFRKSETERSSTKDMLDAFTKNGAYQLIREKEIGIIQVGYKADLTILSDHLEKDNRNEMEDIKIVMTITDGVVRYRK